MKSAVRWSAGAAAVLLMFLGLFFNKPGRELTATSFGNIPAGHGALYELLLELGLPVERSFAALETLPTKRTVWWINPLGLCDSAGATPSADNHAAPLARWVARGGTGVVWLGSPGETCEAVAGATLPTREDPARIEPAETAAGEPRPTPDPKAAEPRAQVSSGRLSPQPRTLSMPPLALFESAGDWEVLAQVGALPLVVSRAIGSGHLVVVADARIAQNAWLDSGDAAPFVVDVAKSFGPPLFDERLHGLRAEESTLRYLLTSAAAPVFVGLLLTGLLVAWHGHAWPARRLPPVAEQVPALESYVDSMATLYARSGDFPRMLERYREMTVARLCRYFGLPPQTPAAQIVDRLRQTRRCSVDSLRLLETDWAVESESALRAATRAFDRLVEEVVG